MNPYFKGKHGPLMIAEIGGNHEGDFEYAKRLTKKAINADVDYVKFQVYTGDSLVSSLESPNRNNHFKKFELTKDEYIYLAEMVKEAGVNFTASVWDIEGIKCLDKYMSLYKVGSGDLTAYPLLKNITQMGKPMIVSTGLASEQEILDTIEYIQSNNAIYYKKEYLALLQCTSMYPIPPKDANLNVMNRLRHLTDLTVGYSDHTEGSKALEYAYVMGAEILEFHFTDSREGKLFRDHKVSLNPEEVNALIEKIYIINEYKGSENKKALKIETDNKHHISFRRAVYPSRDINAGEELTEENLTTLRPLHGIDAREYDDLIGKKAIVDILKHQKMDWNQIK